MSVLGGVDATYSLVMIGSSLVLYVLTRYSGCAAPLQMTDNYPMLMCFNS